jgi:hypothetical protein
MMINKPQLMPVWARLSWTAAHARDRGPRAKPPATITAAANAIMQHLHFGKYVYDNRDD